MSRENGIPTYQTMVHDGDFVLQLLYLVVHELETPLHVLDDVLPRERSQIKHTLLDHVACMYVELYRESYKSPRSSG